MEKEKEYKLRIWFLKHELYSDGSNVESWLEDLKQRLEEIFDINLNEGENPTEK